MHPARTHGTGSLAGTQKLDNLIVLYDDNQITIDGHTEISFTEDVPARFKSYGWHTITVEDGNNDLESLAAAIEEAKSVGDRPTLISVKYVEFPIELDWAYLLYRL